MLRSTEKVEEHFDVGSYAAGIVSAAAPERRDTPRTGASGSRRWFTLYTIYATVSLAAIGVVGASPAGLLAAVLLGATGPVCVLAGTLMHRPAVPAAWWMLGAVILVSAAVRVVGANPDSPATGSVWYLAWGLVPYLLALGAATVLLRARRGPDQPGAIVDGVLVALAAALFIWPFLAVPAAQMQGGGVLFAALCAAYPIASTVMLYRITQLALTRVVNVPAFKLLFAALTVTFAGDVLDAAGDAGHVAVPDELVNILYLLMSVFLSLAALHPSMVKLTETAAIEPARLNRSRIAVLLVALLTPIVVVVTRPQAGPIERVPLLILSVATVTLVMWRVLDSITQYSKSEGRLAHAATHDALTGLPNRVYLMSEVDRLMWRRDRGGLALFFCDLDRFKHVNDTWGHAIGDELLAAVAERLLAAATPFDGTVARIGGDEFVVLCQGVGGGDEALSVATQALTAFTEPFHLSVGEFHMAPSIGVAWCAPDKRETATDFIRHADTAMYTAKRSDPHVALFDDSMQNDAARRLQLENELHGVVSRDELVVHYQPVVDIATGELCSFEALIRWQHPTRGLLNPAEFIPVAEESGSVIEIGDHVMAVTIALLGRWYTEHGPQCPKIAVNVSGRQLRDGRFADRVEELLSAHGVPAGLLCVEITETVILDSSSTTSEQLEHLHTLGVAIAADDFGTGYSSLSYLKQYPVGRVKIDQGFVAGLDHPNGPRPDDVAIIDAVLAMADALGLDVVAEGVENETQRAHLTSRGCRWAQGWLFGKPTTAAEAEHLIGTTLPPAGQPLSEATT